MEFWKEGLKKYEQIVYIPMSSGLGGSCYTAMALAQDDEFEGKVFVVDNGRISPATAALGSLLNIKPILKLGTDVPVVREDKTKGEAICGEFY